MRVLRAIKESYSPSDLGRYLPYGLFTYLVAMPQNNHPVERLANETLEQILEQVSQPIQAHRHDDAMN